MLEPERRLSPRGDKFVFAECGHEVYEGERIYEWEPGTLCPDCMEDRFSELSTQEKAELLGCESSEVVLADFNWGRD